MRITCDFVSLQFNDRMLCYHARAKERLVGTGDRSVFNGARIIRQVWSGMHANTMRSPDAGPIERWRTEMTEAERRVFAEASGRLLGKLGYEESG